MPRSDLVWRIAIWASIVWLLFAYLAIRPATALFGLDVFTGSQLDDVPSHVAKLKADTAPKCFAPSMSVTYASKLGNPFAEFDPDNSTRFAPKPQTPQGGNALTGQADTSSGDQQASVPYTVASVTCITKTQATTAVLAVFFPPLLILGAAIMLTRRSRDARRRPSR